MGKNLNSLFAGNSHFATLQFTEFISRANLPPIRLVLQGHKSEGVGPHGSILRPATAIATFNYNPPLGPNNSLVHTQGAIRLMRPFALFGKGDALHFDLDIDNKGPLPDQTVYDFEVTPDVIGGDLSRLGIRLILTIGPKLVKFNGPIVPLPSKWKLPEITDEAFDADLAELEPA